MANTQTTAKCTCNHLPLTDEQIGTIAQEHVAAGTRSFSEFVRRIEAAHGIKGEA